ncbi:MAG: hypothetical protein JZU64_04615 [Rhodoferax sp.]|jgi:hypothetical protein|nr:hypothetical protein [Rhodoferax sp.]
MTKAKKPQPTQCSVPWEAMSDVDGRIKFCAYCKKEIYPVQSKAEFDQAMIECKCVWFDHGSDTPPLEFGMVHSHPKPIKLPPGAVGGIGPWIPPDGKPLVWTD